MAAKSSSISKQIRSIKLCERSNQIWPLWFVGVSFLQGLVLKPTKCSSWAWLLQQADVIFLHSYCPQPSRYWCPRVWCWCIWRVQAFVRAVLSWDVCIHWRLVSLIYHSMLKLESCGSFPNLWSSSYERGPAFLRTSFSQDKVK